MNPDNVYWYNGEHSITFLNGTTTKNTWTDWGLIPSSRHSEPINGIWSQKVSISGVNGEEDLVRMYPFNAVNSYQKLRSALVNDNEQYIKQNYGYDIFQPSNGSLSFIIADQDVSFFVKQQEILNFLHNRKVQMIFEDDPTKTYIVRTSVDGFSNGDTFSNLTISYSVLQES